MDRNEIRKAIYQKYIVPTQRKPNDFVGAEFELPIVNLNKKAVDFEVVHSLAEAFVEHFDFDKTMLDDEGNIYSSLKNENGDNLSFDCSYSNLELSFGLPEAALKDIEDKSREILNDGKLPLMIGGEHLVTYGAVKAVFEKYPDLQIIHFDAHCDLRDDYLGAKLSHACVIRRCFDLVGDNKIH